MEDALVKARQAAARGDVEKAEQYYELALHNLEHAGVLSHEQVYEVLQAQELVRLNKLTMEEAVQAFSLVYKERISLDAALDKLKLKHDHNPCLNRLAGLLQAAGILTEDALSTALLKAESQGMPLARYLILHGLVPASIVAQAQEMQNFLENGSITREHAVQRIKTSAAQRSSGIALRQVYNS